MRGKNNVWLIESKYHFGSKVTPDNFSGFNFKHEQKNGRSHWSWTGRKLTSKSNVYKVGFPNDPYPMMIEQEGKHSRFIFSPEVY